MISPQETVERALSLSKADGCVVIADETSAANLRWAGNTLTTNGVARSRSLTVISIVEGTQGTSAGVVTRSNVSAEDVESLVRAAEETARTNAPAEDAQPLVVPASADTIGADWDADPAETSIAVFGRLAAELGDAFGRARGAGRLLYGFALHTMTSTYVGSSTGLRLRHVQPDGKLELNAKTPDYSRSAWAGAATRDFVDVDVTALDATLSTRLGWAARQVDLPAGRYETLLPPSAVADLMIYMYWSASGKDALEGRTVFSAPGGRTRVGEQLSSTPLTLRSDPHAEGLECAPFVVAHSSGATSSVFDNGLPLQATDWIREGRLEALLQTRSSAAQANLAVTPGIDNLRLETATPAGTLPQLIADTSRGLLLTCLWYIREVDPQTLLLTGLTRDGVYLVENGEVTGAVNNFRFNESPVDLLNRVADVGITERTLPREWSDWFTRTAMPAIRIPDFNMSSVSAAQ